MWSIQINNKTHCNTRGTSNNINTEIARNRGQLWLHDSNRISRSPHSSPWPYHHHHHHHPATINDLDQIADWWMDCGREQVGTNYTHVALICSARPTAASDGDNAEPFQCIGSWCAADKRPTATCHATVVDRTGEGCSDCAKERRRISSSIVSWTFGAVVTIHPHDKSHPNWQLIISHRDL